MLTTPRYPAVAARTFLIGGMLLIATGSARAQSGMSSGGRSLGGYGAATIGRYYSSGTTAYMPYSGGGYVPYQGGPGGGFAVRPVPRALPQTPIGGTSMAATPIGGASLRAGAMTDRSGTRRSESFRFSSGLGSDMIGRPMTQQSSMRRGSSGPGFGYPFRVPPNLVNGSGGSSPSM